MLCQFFPCDLLKRIHLCDLNAMAITKYINPAFFIQIFSQDYESIMIKTLKKFWKTYDENNTRIAVNNIGPQVLKATAA